MIDWVTATLPFSHSTRFVGGRVLSMDADGVLEWQTEKRLPVVGSFDSRFHIVSRGDMFPSSASKLGHVTREGVEKLYRESLNLRYAH